MAKCHNEIETEIPQITVINNKDMPNDHKDTKRDKETQKNHKVMQKITTKTLQNSTKRKYSHTSC